jgi:uncharacterized protein (DUF433 family)
MTRNQDVICAFTADQVTRLTGLSKRQLAHWDQIGFFQPQFADIERRSPYSRLYSFKDVVGLRTLGILRTKHHISLSHLQDVAGELSERFATSTPWADIRLAVLNKKVQFCDPVTGLFVGAVDGQYVLLPILDVKEEVQQAVNDLRKRQDEAIGRIEKHRYVAHNAPVVGGTRVRVSSIVHYLAAGFSPQQIIEEYPSLTEADIEAVIRHQGADAAA